MSAPRFSRALLALLLTVLLAGRLAVPAGWMPVRTEQGMSIMLCSGSGPAQAWIDAAGKVHRGPKPDGSKGGEPKDPCPFAAHFAVAALPAISAPAALAPLPSDPPVPAPLAAAIGRGLAAPPPPATGPPAHSA